MSFEIFTKKLALTLGVIKVVLVAAFFLSFSLIAPQASLADETAKCDGTNLLNKLENEDPEAFAKLQSQGDAVINGKSTYWKIEKDGLPVSYLFGTMHMADPQIATLSAEVKTTIKNSDTLVIESLDVLDPEATKAQMTEVQHLMLLKEGTLKDLIRDDLEDELEEAVTKRGLPMMFADRMRPWLIATTIATPLCEIELKQAGQNVLDIALAEHAKANSVSLKGLESLAEQFTAMSSISQAYHIAAIEESLESKTLSIDMIETLKATYLKGEMGIVMPMMEYFSPNSASKENSAEFQKILIEKRNFVMLKRALPILEKEKTFLAVGALHLTGETGLVELLRKEGFTLTAVK